MGIGPHLERLLLELGISQTELARRLGVPQPNVAAWISGARANPRRDTIERIAKALGVEPSRLMSGERQTNQGGVSRSTEEPSPERVKAAVQLFLEMTEDERESFVNTALSLEKSLRGNKHVKAEDAETKPHDSRRVRGDRKQDDKRSR